MSLVSFVVVLVILALMFWAVGAPVSASSIPEPSVTIIRVIIVVVIIFWLLQASGLLALAGPPIFLE